MGALLGTLIAFGLLFYFLGKRLKPAHRPSESLPEKSAINE
jgi:hypothetical protein